MSIQLHDKEHALKRIDYVKNLYYTDPEYAREIRKQILRYQDKANGVLNNRVSAQEELMMFEEYGFTNLKNYTLDVLMQNVEYCTVLEKESHDEQIAQTIEYLEKSDDLNYLLTLRDFSIKNEDIWYIPVNRILNWIDSFMIQKEVFFKYGVGENPLLYVAPYFNDNVLLMCVYTDNEENNYNSDMNAILDAYDNLTKSVIDILKGLPQDYMIDDLFNISDDKIKENDEKIKNLRNEYIELIKNS